MNNLTNTTQSISQNTHTIPNWRLHLMRGLFFLNFISLASDNWSQVLFPDGSLDTLTGVTISFWAAFSILNLFGIRFPLKFTPILLLQLLYKSAWILGTYRPAKTSGTLNEDLSSFLFVCLAGIVLNLLIIPWKYVFEEYVKDLFKLK